MFKRIFLALCLLALCVGVSSGGITDKLKSVIARKNVAAGGGTYMVKPAGDSSTQWTTNGAGSSNADRVNDCADFACASPTESTYLDNDYEQSARTDTYTMSDNVSQVGNTSQIVCKVNNRDEEDQGNSDLIELRITIGGGPEVDPGGSVEPEDAWGFTTFTFTGVWSAAEVDAMTLDLIGYDPDGDVRIEASEIVCEVTY